jgi:hypothetical protein
MVRNINITFRAIGSGSQDVVNVKGRTLTPEEFLHYQSKLKPVVEGAEAPQLDDDLTGSNHCGAVILVPAVNLPEKFHKAWGHTVAIPSEFFNQFVVHEVKCEGRYAEVHAELDRDAVFKAWKKAGYPTFWGFDKSDKSIQTVKTSPRRGRKRGSAIKRALQALKTMHATTRKRTFRYVDFENGVHGAEIPVQDATIKRYLKLLEVKGYISPPKDNGIYVLTSMFLNLR